MNVLGVDTVIRGCSVAILINGKLVSTLLNDQSKKQSEVLISMISEACEGANLNIFEFDLIAVTIGPGSFTGLRVGIATARGLALAADIPCIGVTSTEAFAQSISCETYDRGPVLVALNSTNENLFFQLFGSGRVPLTQVFEGTPKKLKDKLGQLKVTELVRVVGQASEMVCSELSRSSFNLRIVEGFDWPNAGHVAELAFKRHKSGNNQLDAKPLYIKAPCAVMPISGGKLRP